MGYVFRGLVAHFRPCHSGLSLIGRGVAPLDLSTLGFVQADYSSTIQKPPIQDVCLLGQLRPPFTHDRIELFLVPQRIRVNVVARDETENCHSVGRNLVIKAP